MKNFYIQSAIKRLKTEKQNKDNNARQILDSVYSFCPELISRKNALTIEIAKNEFEGIDCLGLIKEQNDIKNQIALIAKQKLNIDLSSLEKPICPICNDKLSVDGKWCECIIKKAVDVIYSYSNLNEKVPATFETSNFDLFFEQDKENIKKTYITIEQWCKNFNKNSKINVGFIGGTGTGKTHLAMCMANCLIKRGIDVYFTTAFSLCNELKEYANSFDQPNEMIAPYMNCEVLIIDDLGAEPKLKEKIINCLYLIINERYVANKSIIFTSNLLPDMLRERYGERIFSRIISKQKTILLQIDGKDIRLKKN